MTIPCARCLALIEKKPRGRTPRFCGSCQRERRLEQQRERDRDKATLRREIMADLEHWRDAHEYEAAGLEYLHPRIDEFVDAWVKYDTDNAVLIDAMPPGSYSPTGSEDGRSTYFTDLAGDLDQLSYEASVHPWHGANPHWAYPFTISERAEYLNAA